MTPTHDTPADLSAERLAEIRARLDAAKRGPWGVPHPNWAVSMAEDIADLLAEVDRLRNTIAANAEECAEVHGCPHVVTDGGTSYCTPNGDPRWQELATTLADILASIISAERAIDHEDWMTLQVATSDIRDGIAALERHRALCEGEG